MAMIELVLERAIFIDCFFLSFSVCLDFVLIRYEMRLSRLNSQRVPEKRE